MKSRRRIPKRCARCGAYPLRAALSVLLLVLAHLVLLLHPNPWHLAMTQQAQPASPVQRQCSLASLAQCRQVSAGSAFPVITS